MASNRPTKIAFERMYTEDLVGVEYAVRYEDNEGRPRVEIQHIDNIYFPLEDFDWLIDTLIALRSHIGKDPGVIPEGPIPR